MCEVVCHQGAFKIGINDPGRLGNEGVATLAVKKGDLVTGTLWSGADDDLL